MALSGMRPGELYALHWEDIDLQRGCIHVRRAVWRGRVGSTKTGSPREVALPHAMAQVLGDHKAQQRASQRRISGEDLVFPAATGGFRSSSSLLNILRTISAIAELSVRVTPQVLRRTFNTLLLEAGVNEVVLRAQMGHTTRRMTERYAGVHIGRKQEAVEALLEALPSVPPTPNSGA